MQGAAGVLDVDAIAPGGRGARGAVVGDLVADAGLIARAQRVWSGHLADRQVGRRGQGYVQCARGRVVGVAAALAGLPISVRFDEYEVVAGKVARQRQRSLAAIALSRSEHAAVGQRAGNDDVVATRLRIR